MINKEKILFYLYALVFITFPFGFLVTIGSDNSARITVLDISVILFVIASVFLGKVQKKVNFNKEIKLFLFASLLTIALHVFINPTNSVYVSLLYFIRISFYFLFYIKSTALFNKQSAITINRILFFVGYTLSIIGLIQYQVYPDLRNLLYLGWDPHYYRLFSTLFDPNFAGIILVLTFFQYLFLLKYRINTRSKTLDLIVLTVLLFSIYLTRSRSAYISLAAGLVFYVWLLKKISWKLTGLLITVLLVANFLPKPPVDVFDLLRITSSVSRINNWKQAFIEGINNPLIGIGFSKARFSDSSFLYVFAATGILGIAAFINLWVKIIAFGLNKDKELTVISLILLVSSFFNNTLFYPFVAVWFFAFLSSSVSRFSRR